MPCRLVRQHLDCQPCNPALHPAPPAQRDPSILHFLVASGDDITSKQLRDDLMVRRSGCVASGTQRAGGRRRAAGLQPGLAAGGWPGGSMPAARVRTARALA